MTHRGHKTSMGGGSADLDNRAADTAPTHSRSCAGGAVSEAEVEAACRSIWGHLWAYSPIVEASRRSELRTALEAAAKVREGK